jgi:RimJ/RimL family protein N-acetyltransferase
MADPRTVRYLGGEPHSREETWRRLLMCAGLWPTLGYGYWAVERKEDGVMVAQVGFSDFKRGMTPSIEGLPEMGWILAPDAYGQGYASEAVAAGLTWADETLQPPEIVAIIDADNAPSIRVAEKAGFNSREDAVYRDAPIQLFRRRR